MVVNKVDDACNPQNDKICSDGEYNQEREKLKDNHVVPSSFGGSTYTSISPGFRLLSFQYLHASSHVLQ
jgi:hypothetical protein